MTLTYDGAGNLTSQSDRAGTTGYAFDRRNLVTSKTLPGGTVTSLTYDNTGNISTYSDPGGTIGYAYDAANRPSEVTEPGGDCLVTPKVKCTQFSYDTAGRRADVKYPNKVTQTYGYDSSSRLTTLLANDNTGGLLTKQTYTYNKTNSTPTTSDDDTSLRQSATEFTGSADSSGVTSTYTHDSHNQLTNAAAWLARLDADAPLAHWRLGEGSGTAIDDRRGTRDGTLAATGATLGRPGAVAGDSDKAIRFTGTSAVNVLDDPSLRLNGAFSINLLARVNTQVGSFPGLLGKGNSSQSGTLGGGYELYYKTDGSVTFKKNSQDNFSTSTGALTPGGKYRMITVTYDGTAVRMYVDGVKHSTTVAALGTATETSPLTLGRYNSGDHDLDDVALWNSALSDTQVQRLAWARDAGATYTYDLAGNRTSQRDTLTRERDLIDGIWNYTHNDANEILTRDGSATGYAYDGNGNQTSTPTSPLATTSTPLTTTYDAADQATSFTLGAATLSSTYAGADQYERTAADGLTLINSPLGINGQLPGGAGTGTYFTRAPNGELLSIRRGTANASSDISYYLYDGLGSVTALTDNTGAVINRYRYDPYGNQLQATENLAQPFGYTGGYRDSKTGLVKLGIRYYNPSEGRFTQADPTGQSQQYLYTDNSPASFADPTGAISRSVALKIASAIVGVAAIPASGGLSLGLTAASIGLDVGATYSSTGSLVAAVTTALLDLSTTGIAAIAGRADPWRGCREPTRLRLDHQWIVHLGRFVCQTTSLRRQALSMA